MEKTVRGNMLQILKGALSKIKDGKIYFLGPSGGFVRVMFMEGKVLHVDSTWGVGKDELQKILMWNTGTCAIKELTPAEKEDLKSKLANAQKTTQEPGTKTTISVEHPVEVKTVYKALKRKFLNLDGFMEEMKQNESSGEARVNTGEQVIRILFWKGFPLLVSGKKDIEMWQALEAVDTPDALLDFYLLGEELTHAFASVIAGEMLWQQLPIAAVKLDEMLGQLMEQELTGHVLINNKYRGPLHFFFWKGRPLGVFDIKHDWEPVPVSTAFDDVENISAFKSGDMEVYLSQAPAPISPEVAGRFLSLWNQFMDEISHKIGKKPVQKCLERHLAKTSFKCLNLDGVHMSMTENTYGAARNCSICLNAHLKEILHDLNGIIGGKWLSKRLNELIEQNQQIVQKAGLWETLSTMEI